VFISILAEKKKITFGIDYCFPVPRIIQTDPIRLKQILINLCGNAVKFGEKNDIVIEIYCDPLESSMSFSVKDNGIGIKANELAFIFDPFYTSKRGSGHRGLDLHIVFNIINHKLGGFIDCQSQPGEGCCFTITLEI